VNPNSIANTLRDLKSEIKIEAVSVSWLLGALRRRAYGFLLLLLAMPNYRSRSLCASNREFSYFQ
jgi:hypothetical protein